MSDFFPEDWQERAWAKLPVSIRRRAVARLKAGYDPEFFNDVRRLVEERGFEDWMPVGWHFGQGMQVRNLLRSDHKVPKVVRKAAPPIKDSELPTLREFYGDEACGNWDDFYQAALEAAAGLREIDA